MRNHTEHRTTGCRAKRMAWLFLASAALLVGCAAQPKSTAPTEQAAQPAPREVQAAEVAQPAGAPENEAAPPPSKPTERSVASSAKPSETARVRPVSAGSASNQPVASTAGQTDDRPIAGPTVGAQAPRSQTRTSAAAMPEPRHPTQDAPAAKPTRKPPVSEPSKDKPDATRAKGQHGTTVSQDRPAAKPQPPQKPDQKAVKPAGGCGAKSGASEPTPSPTGPQPRWVCKDPKCIIEPLWRGEKAEFVFAISNEGEGDLQIKIKGG